MPPARDCAGIGAGFQHKRQQDLKVAVPAPTQTHSPTQTNSHSKAHSHTSISSHTDTFLHTDTLPHIDALTQTYTIDALTYRHTHIDTLIHRYTHNTHSQILRYWHIDTSACR